MLPTLVMNNAQSDLAAERIRAAQATLGQDRRAAMAQLNQVFRSGAAPRALHGRTAGQLVALEIAPGLTQAATALASAWMPWQGKTFDTRRDYGDNIFDRSSYGLARVFWPFYRHYIDDGAQTYRAFAFRTSVGPGLMDPDVSVLRIDYDLPENPAPSIRRVLDELVEIGDGYYLGKAHLKWWWGRWQTVAFFTLRLADEQGM